MKASVIIPNYNGKKYLKTCIDSLMKQTFKDYEILIIDNCSQDGSFEFIRDIYSNVQFIKLDKNYGFSFAVNTGIKKSKGEYVVLLNNDTEVAECWLSNLITCIEKNKKVFSCSSKMLRFDNRELIDDAGDQFTIVGWAYKVGDGLSKDKYCKDREIFSSCAGAAIYRREIFSEIGYFDEDFFAYLEDLDISYRAKIYGYKKYIL